MTPTVPLPYAQKPATYLSSDELSPHPHNVFI